MEATKSRIVYTVMVGRSQVVNRNLKALAPSPDHTCDHNHRSEETALKCLGRLQNSRFENGSWTCSARWYNGFIHAHTADSNDYLHLFEEEYFL